MEHRKVCTLLLVLLLKFHIFKAIDINPDDMLGFEAPAQSNREWIDPDDMGLPSKIIPISTKPDDTKSKHLDVSELSKSKNSTDVLQEVIEALKTNLSSLQEENYKLNKSNHELHLKYSNLKNISANVIHPVSNHDNKDPSTSKTGDPEKQTPCKEPLRQGTNEVPFLLRFTKVLTRKLKLNVKDNEMLPWKFENDNSRKTDRVLRYMATLRLSEKDVKVLQLLSQKLNSDTAGHLYNLDNVLSNLLLEARPETTEEMDRALNVDYVALIAHYLPSENDVIWIAIIASFTCVSFFLYTGRLNLWKFLCLLFFISSVWHWTRMYKKALTEKHITLSKSKQIPNECSPGSMSWGHFVLDSIFIRQDKCKEYYEALMIDPLLEVTPTMALAETFTAFIVQPMEHLGRHIGKFFNALLQETSWLSSPVILSFVFIAILLCLVMLFGYRFRLPFFLGSFEPRNNLSDSFALERKEQKSMIIELKSTLDALKEVSTPLKQISHTSLQKTSNNIQSLKYENFKEISSTVILSDECLTLNTAESSTNCSPYHIPNMKARENTNLKRASSSPNIFTALQESQLLQDQTISFNVGGAIPVEKGKDATPKDFHNNKELNESNLNVNADQSLKELVNMYQSPPNKKLVVKKNDKDPKETDFEWVTEILGDKLVDIQGQSSEVTKCDRETENELIIEESDFLFKAKGLFNEVLQK